MTDVTTCGGRVIITGGPTGTATHTFVVGCGGAANNSRGRSRVFPKRPREISSELELTESDLLISFPFSSQFSPDLDSDVDTERETSALLKWPLDALG